MDISVYSIKAISDEEVAKLIDERRSFVLEDVARLSMPEAVEALEKLIEGKGLSCRVYTKGRVAAVGAFAVPNPVTAAVSLGSAAFIGAHNLATFNPDYEIAKNLATGTITLEAQEKWSIDGTWDSVAGLFKTEK
ncbi:hypothetical protein ACVCNH_18305 [Achromobacter anxifer]